MGLKDAAPVEQRTAALLTRLALWSTATEMFFLVRGKREGKITGKRSQSLEDASE